MNRKMANQPGASREFEGPKEYKARPNAVHEARHAATASGAAVRCQVTTGILSLLSAVMPIPAPTNKKPAISDRHRDDQPARDALRRWVQDGFLAPTCE